MATQKVAFGNLFKNFGDILSDMPAQDRIRKTDQMRVLQFATSMRTSDLNQQMAILKLHDYKSPEEMLALQSKYRLAEKKQGISMDYTANIEKVKGEFATGLDLRKAEAGDEPFRFQGITINAKSADEISAQTKTDLEAIAGMGAVESFETDPRTGRIIKLKLKGISSGQSFTPTEVFKMWEKYGTKISDEFKAKMIIYDKTILKYSQDAIDTEAIYNETTDPTERLNLEAVMAKQKLTQPKLPVKPNILSIQDYSSWIQQTFSGQNTAFGQKFSARMNVPFQAVPYNPETGQVGGLTPSIPNQLYGKNPNEMTLEEMEAYFEAKLGKSIDEIYDGGEL